VEDTLNKSFIKEKPSRPIRDRAYDSDLVHEKWTGPNPSREEIHTGVRSAVRMMLRRQGIKEKDLEPFLGSVMVQAQALYAEWPLGADLEQ
jgi:hypothetical protein